VGLSVTILGCSGSYPGPDRASSGYLVRTATTNVWLDCGPGTFSALQHVIDPNDIDAIVLSHAHVDHWLDIASARTAFAYFLDRHDLPVYGTAETEAFLRPLIGHTDRAFAWTTIDASSRLRLGDLDVSFSRTDHPPETLAARFDHNGRSLAYSADTGAGWSMTALGDGIDLALIEASLPVEREGSFEHLSGRQAGVMAHEAGVARLVITHVVPGVDVEQQRRDAEDAFGGPVEAAAPMRRFEL
jgi:ribonuclease BN (tRNA processing enzyme)